MFNSIETNVRYKRAALPRVNMMPTFADRMRQLRKSRKWSQLDAAKEFTAYMKIHRSPDDTKTHNYAPQHISDWERGTIARGDTLDHLARFFNVSVSFLLGATDNPAPEVTDLEPAEVQLVAKLRQHPDEASLIYRAYGIEPPARTLSAGDTSAPEQANQ